MTRIMGSETREENKPGQCVGCNKETKFFCPFCYHYLFLIIHLCESPDCREKHETSEQGCVRTKNKAATT